MEVGCQFISLLFALNRFLVVCQEESLQLSELSPSTPHGGLVLRPHCRQGVHPKSGHCSPKCKNDQVGDSEVKKKKLDLPNSSKTYEELAPGHS